MSKLLHIIASPREDKSRTREISDTFLKTFTEKHPDWRIDEINLAKETLPALSIKRVDGKYMLIAGKELTGEPREAWDEILKHIDRFLSADLYLITTPMWNFSIPYMLKQYIDVIVQPKYLFRYTESGVEGLAKNKKMVVASTRGGEYVSKEMQPMDFQEPYLRAVFGFVGITDITFIKAEPMDMGKERQMKELAQAKEFAKEVGSHA